MKQAEKPVQTHYDVIVIGGGASGMMAAGRAAEQGRSVLLLERNKRLGEKIRISGGGRCNITNAEPDERKLLARYGKAEPFLYSAFAKFGVQDTFSFFENLGLPLVVEGKNRAFPETQKAADVVAALERYMEVHGVKVRKGVRVIRFERNDGKIEKLITSEGEFTADAFVLSTGGVSHPETGSTGDGFTWLKELDHTVQDPTPTIVPLKVEEKWISAFTGISLPAMKITFFADGKKKAAFSGPLLFTHFGISGPTVLNAAGQVADWLQEGAVTAKVDLFPEADLGILDKQLADVFREHSNKSLKNALREAVPPGSADALLSLLPEIDPEQKAHSFPKEERRALAELLKAVPLTIKGLMGFERAVIADGGVPLEEIDMRTMRSKKIENLFVTGDLLHINRPSGGFSFQLCWTTGFVAGDSV